MPERRTLVRALSTLGYGWAGINTMAERGLSAEELQEQQIQQWRIKNLIKSLEAARGNGTSMISLIVPPKGQIAAVQHMLTDEYGTASNIKSRVNRLSVLGAITSTQQRLKLYKNIPENGLVVYCGTVVSEDGKEKKISRDFEPFKPINTSLYLCVAGSAVVATQSGAGRRLGDIVATRVDETVVAAGSAGLAGSAVGSFMDNGVRECVEIELCDGRTVTCTPDHRVLAEHRGGMQWVEAQDLAEGQRVLCGPDAPEDVVGADEAGWGLDKVGALDDGAEARARVLAFARVSGLVAVATAGARSLSVAHKLDVGSIQADVAAAVGVWPQARGLEVELPAALTDLAAPAGTWPAWAVARDTPRCVVREFLGAVFGAVGRAPRVRDGQLVHRTLLEVRTTPTQAEAVAHALGAACRALERLGVDGAHVRGSGTRVAVCLASGEGSAAFDACVGFRLSVEKQARNSAAAVYRRMAARGEATSVDAVLGAIGARGLLADGDTRMAAGSGLLLAVRGVREAGRHAVYDISVPAARSFTANGVVVHNCDNKFHTGPLRELLEDDDRFGFVVMDGLGTLFGRLSGNTREVLQRIVVDLPKKHGRGGQSAMRFARLRDEKRHNYVRKVAELCVQNFITNDKVNVTGLVLSGLADLKNELFGSDMFDQRLKKKVIKIVDVSYGGENGFNQAIELASETLKNVKLVREKKLLASFMSHLAKDTGKYAIGLQETMTALEMGAAETVIVWEGLELERVTLRNAVTAEEVVQVLSPEQKRDSQLKDKDGSALEIVNSVQFLEWLSENYRNFGAALEFVSDRSEEGNQFVRGFGGIGAILRYQVESSILQQDQDGGDEESDDEDDWEL